MTGRVLDAMTNRPIPNALLSVGSLYTTRADANGGFLLRAVAGDQTVTARAPGYTTATADTTIPKDGTVSIGYIRLVPLYVPSGQPTLLAAGDPVATPVGDAGNSGIERKSVGSAGRRTPRASTPAAPSPAATVAPSPGRFEHAVAG